MLSALDRAAAEHLGWLRQVHEELLFGHRPEPKPPELPCLIRAWAQAPEISPVAAEERAEALGRLRQAHARMLHGAARLAAAQAPHATDYRAFMAAVEDYGAALRAIDGLLHQLVAETDPLTGVSNRLGMIRDLEREAQRSARTGQPCCLALLDLDHFKAINDGYGHLAGDRVLTMAARFFVRRLRPYDRVYRYGGEEFLFCLPETEPDMAERVLNRLRVLLARLPMPLGDGRTVRVTASIGLAAIGGGSRALALAIAQADTAVYAAKAGGRNRVCIAHDPPTAVRGDAVAQIGL